MAANNWPTKSRLVASLHLDAKNPRLGRETTTRAPREIIQYLFEHDKAMEVAQSIATRGYFPNEPLLAIKENGHIVVVEGNRRLAALKALREPGLIEGTMYRRIERLARQIADQNDIARAPVTLAPSRRATDRLLAGRHIGTPVLPWQAENRASFILDKLSEGYTNEQLRDQLGFSLTDIQEARQTRAIADMARSLDLPDEVKAKLDNPRAKVFTTLERVFDSSVGRNYLKVEPDPEHGLHGITTKAQFLKGFKKLVTDIALGHESSRSLNTNDDIKTYFQKWSPKDLPSKKRGSFVPADIIQGGSVASAVGKPKPQVGQKPLQKVNTVLPRDFKVRYGSDRLRDIRNELVKLKRANFPNAGAVLLRVFFELSVRNYLERTGDLLQIVAKIEKKEKRKLPFGVPNLKQLVPEITRHAKEKLSESDAIKVEKAIKYDRSAPFTISDLHGFVHQEDFPGERDILQFWKRTEPLFRLMLEQELQEKS
jgi:ParB-like chromosome segregation protein Spo0J